MQSFIRTGHFALGSGSPCFLLCALILACGPLALASDQQLPYRTSPASEPALSQLVTSLSNHIVDIPGGLGVSVRMPAALTSVRELSVLARWELLRDLTLACNSSSNEPSAAAVRALQTADGLRSLTLQCCGYLPDGCLEAVGTLHQINSLTLVDAIPRNSSAYCLLTNASSIRRLIISFPRSFGEADVKALKELSQVRDLRLFRVKPPEDLYRPLLSMPEVTNLLIVLPDSRVELKRSSGRQ